jgi:RimJ/RimL family protein N-acetyltransferase
MNVSSPILTTDRLSLREMSLDDDLDFIYSILSHPEVMRFYPKCYSRDESAEWISRQMERYKSDGCGLWLVEDKRTGTSIGQIGLVRREIDGVPLLEVGYLVARQHWRQGYASEAAAGCRDHAFTAFGQDRVIALIRPENLPSQGVAGKIGMQPGKLIEHAGMPHIVFFIERGKAQEE